MEKTQITREEVLNHLAQLKWNANTNDRWRVNAIADYLDQMKESLQLIREKIFELFQSNLIFISKTSRISLLIIAI
jgi:ATP-dependent Lon protease